MEGFKEFLAENFIKRFLLRILSNVFKVSDKKHKQFLVDVRQFHEYVKADNSEAAFRMFIEAFYNYCYNTATTRYFFTMTKSEFIELAIFQQSRISKLHAAIEVIRPGEPDSTTKRYQEYLGSEIVIKDKAKLIKQIRQSKIQIRLMIKSLKKLPLADRQLTILPDLIVSKYDTEMVISQPFVDFFTKKVRDKLLIEVNSFNFRK